MQDDICWYYILQCQFRALACRFLVSSSQQYYNDMHIVTSEHFRNSYRTQILSSHLQNRAVSFS